MIKKVFFNIGFWIFLWLVFAFSIMQFDSAPEAFRISSLIIFPLIIPVYIHDFLFDYFIIRKQYLFYFLSTAFVVLFFGYIIGQFQHYLEPGGSSETYGALLFMMLLYTGARYFRIGTQQKMQLKEEEERRIRAEMELKELEAKQSQAELNMLKSQVNPHFLFNTLNSIYSLILSNSEMAAEAVMKLSDLMRYLLESSTKRKVLVKHEFDFLQNYIDLEKIRLGRKARVNSQFSGEVSGKIISPLLLIPFIENCFKHGIGVNSSKNKITIEVSMDEQTVNLHTSNNIAGKASVNRPGTGVENVKKRLELLYPGNYDLKIDADDVSYIVNLMIKI